LKGRRGLAGSRTRPDPTLCLSCNRRCVYVVAENILNGLV
jgi:hypothetical protein